ncbi:MAG: HAD-IC family P-type ATPase, partial [Chlamydiota bacterium]
MVYDFKRRFWISLVLTIPILILSPMIQSFLGVTDFLHFSGDAYLLFAFSSGVFFYGGWPFIKGLFQELKAKTPGMMTLIGVAILVAYLYSSFIVFGLKGKLFFWELATLIDIMLLGHWIEMKSIMGAGKALEELAKLMPSIAHKIMPDKSIQDVPIAELQLEDKVLIKPGEKIPADGEIIEGESSINESMLTGESKPIKKSAGDRAIGGSINGEGAITIQVKKIGKDSYLSQVIDLVKEAQSSKSKAQNLANRAALWLTIVALSGGVLTLLVWIFFTQQPFSFAMERAVTVMVITCPHALGLAVPLVVAVSTAIAAGKGLLIRNRSSFEESRKITAIVFDKTGTLTEGKFGVTDTIALEGGEDEVLSFAAAVEAHSEHPIAKGIVASTEKIEAVQDFKA